MATAETGTGDADTFNDVFKSLDDVMKCLHSEKYFHLPEVKRLLEIYNRYISVIHDEVVDRSQRKVFIVLEGMDASGKSTISKRLAKLIGGRMLSTPPPILAWLRNQFDKHGGELRRAYYALGNYLAAQQVKEIYKTQPVVMDRFWHSTATYAIAKHAVEESDGKVPEAGHEIYKWPEDLVKPDIVFLLCVSESKRIERLLCRSKKEITPEELMTKDNEALRKAMHKAYLNMVNPGVRTINANNKYALPTCTKILTEENLVQVSQPGPANLKYTQDFVNGSYKN